jgi:hypothetical protein
MNAWPASPRHADAVSARVMRCEYAKRLAAAAAARVLPTAHDAEDVLESFKLVEAAMELMRPIAARL